MNKFKLTFITDLSTCFKYFYPLVWEKSHYKETSMQKLFSVLFSVFFGVAVCFICVVPASSSTEEEALEVSQIALSWLLHGLDLNQAHRQLTYDSVG
jgi:hypothetical protein